MGYLAINMSGSSIPVYSTNIESNVQIGRLNHKERFAVIDDGPITRIIKFLSSSGQWIDGRIDMNARINDWCDYKFSMVTGVGDTVYGFRVDSNVRLLNADGDYVTTITPGCFIIPANPYKAENGRRYTDHLKIDYVLGPYGYFVESSRGAVFADCGIRRNSGNTPVYGNWN